MKSTQLYTWKDNRHLPDIDDEQVEDNVSVSAGGGLLGKVDAANQRLHFPHKSNFLSSLSSLAFPPMSSLQYANRSVRTSLICYA